MRNALMRLQKPWLIVLSAMPVSLLLCMLWLSGQPLLWYVVPVSYFVIATALLPVRGRLRPVLGAAGAVVIIGICAALLPWQDTPLLLLQPVLFAALLLGFLHDCSLPVEMQLPPQVPIFGLVGYIAMQFYMTVTKGPALHLQICFLLWLPAALFYMNRLDLLHASMDGRSNVPASIRKRNTLLVVLVSIAAVAVSFLPAIAAGLEMLWQLLLSIARWFVKLLSLLQQEATGTQSGGGGIGEMLGDLPASEPSAFVILLEKIFYVLALILLIGGIILMLVVIWKKLRGLIRRLIDGFRRYVDRASQDYEDEAIDTREPDDTSRHAQRRAPGRRKAQTASMSPRERIRHTFRVLRSRDRHWDAARSARDVLTTDAASIYEEARYSTHEIQPEQAAAFDAACRAEAQQKKGFRRSGVE